MSRMTLRGAGCVLSAALVFGWASSARAAGMLTSDGRNIDADMVLSDAGGPSTTYNPGPKTPASLGASFSDFYDFAGSSPGGDAFGDIFVDQDTQFDSSPSFSVFSGAGLAQASGDATFNPSAFASADGVSEVLFEFNITEPQDYSFSGELDASNDAGALVRARLRPVGGSVIFFTTATGPFMDSGTLMPGNYEVQVRALITDSTTGGAFDLDASFNNVVFSITPVPEPASAVLLAIGGLATARCRRQAA